MVSNNLSSRFKYVLLVLVLAIFLSGCAFIRLEREVAELEKTYVLSGKIKNDLSHMGPVVVILYSEKEDKKEIVEYTLPENTGDFSFLVTEGNYYLAAFEDLNQDFAYDQKGLVGYFGAPDRIVVSSDQLSLSELKRIDNLNILLTKADVFLQGFPTEVDNEALSQRNFEKIGDITGLDNKIFALQNGTIGYWRPLTFLRDFGHGVYFIEPYDKNKIPILFVHGASGTPVSWKKIAEQIDRQKYQPWFYYYPSGIQLKLIASGLNDVIKKLHDKYRFNTLYVTAHSMGGLVSRAFIMKNIYQDGEEYIKLFISISTPWDGHRAAKEGVEDAPSVIPSWYDMVPGSEFIQSIYKKKLPSPITFHLFFSFRGECKMLMANNDGSVELASELDYRAQEEAKKIIGFDEDHVSILSSQIFIDYYNQTLASFRQVRGMHISDFGIAR